MIEFKLERKYKKEKYTIGNLYVNGDFVCNILEDADRGLKKDMPLSEIKRIKVYGETAIPAGRYEIELSLSPRFGRQLPLLLNVPGYSGIRIHRGNTNEDSLGCLLPGENKAKGKVINSAKWEERIINMMRKAKEDGEPCFITIE